jgi:ATP-binding cassette subfamily C exporter for protease/lipase/ATP-binding cassette subfamily C protein EexD
MNNTDSNILKSITHACRHAFYIVGIFSFFINILLLTTSIYMLQVYDRVLASRSYDTLIYLTLAAMIALITLALLDIARSRILVQVSYWLDNSLNRPALQRCVDEMLQGRLYGPQALRDIATIRQFVSGSGIFSLFDAFWMPIYLLAILYLNFYLFLLATLGAFILFSLAIVNEMITRSLLVEANAQAISSQYYADASLRNAEIIQAMGMMNNIINHWDAKNSTVLQYQTIASNRAGAILAISKFVRLVLQILILGIGASLVIANQLTGGGMIASTILLSRALSPVEQAISIWKQWLSTKQAYYRLQRLYATPQREQTQIKLPDPVGNIILENVIYRIQNTDKAIINNISFQIKAGELIAIIGPSGAGKSTLARLMIGALKPTSGSIRLDGVDVYTWERTDFGRHVGYLPQDIELFNGTVKDNIARMGVCDDESVIAAAKLAEVHEMILHLPKGYDTTIGDNSYVLSGGIRQRIALARTLYQLPRFLVLDEPNSHLDNEGEEALLRALLVMKEKNTTQVIITHKPSLVKHVDKIIFIFDGKIKLAGPREQVLNELQHIFTQVKRS